MIRLNDTYKIAEAEGIEVLSSSDLKLTESVSVQLPDGKCFIGINSETMTEAEEKVHLMHELGHCVLGAFYNPYAVLDVRKQHERRADKWAILRLIPRDEWNYTIEHENAEIWALAEKFGVSEDYIHKAAELYSA